MTSLRSFSNPSKNVSIWLKYGLFSVKDFDYSGPTVFLEFEVSSSKLCYQINSFIKFTPRSRIKLTLVLETIYLQNVANDTSRINYVIGYLLTFFTSACIFFSGPFFENTFVFQI